MEFVGKHTVDSLFKFYYAFGLERKDSFINGIDKIEDEVKEGRCVILEGSQGALLDRIHGIYPHVT